MLLTGQVVHGNTVTSVTEGGDAVQDEDEDAIRQKREAELADLQSTLDALSAEAAQLESLGHSSMATARFLEAEIATVTEETSTLESTYKVRRHSGWMQ